jgi:hypothetical protein
VESRRAAPTTTGVMPTAEIRVPGRRSPLAPRWPVPLPPDGDARGLTLRDLIARAVVAEVAAFAARQEEARLVHLLTASRVSQGVAEGRVSPGRRNLRQPVDADEAVGMALRAFEDGLFLVVVDGRQRTELDEEIHLDETSTITFLRLVALAGG